MCVPGTDVGIARNGPPVSVFGLGSQLSSWLKPPDSQMTRICFCEAASSRHGRLQQPRKADRRHARRAGQRAQELAPLEQVFGAIGRHSGTSCQILLAPINLLERWSSLDANSIAAPHPNSNPNPH